VGGWVGVSCKHGDCAVCTLTPFLIWIWTSMTFLDAPYHPLPCITPACVLICSYANMPPLNVARCFVEGGFDRQRKGRDGAELSELPAVSVGQCHLTV
jgi:hypothetical protein